MVSVSSPAAPVTNAPDFELFFEMLKSVRGGDGRVWVEGIASDQSEDTDGEIVKAAAYPQSIEYLGQFGKFNYDHNRGIIGDITEAGFISPQDALKRYGVIVKGHAVRVRGWFAPLESAPDDSDLKELHKLHKSGAKLGFSMQGLYKSRRKIVLSDGRTVTVAVPGFVPQVAITPQPKNSNAVCFAKSMAAVVVGEGLGREHHSEGEPGTHSWPVVICSPVQVVGRDEAATGTFSENFVKSLECSGVLATEGTTGGDALKTQDLHGRVAKGAPAKFASDKTSSKPKNDEEDDEEPTHEMKKGGLPNWLDTHQTLMQRNPDYARHVLEAQKIFTCETQGETQHNPFPASTPVVAGCNGLSPERRAQFQKGLRELIEAVAPVCG